MTVVTSNRRKARRLPLVLIVLVVSVGIIAGIGLCFASSLTTVENTIFMVLGCSHCGHRLENSDLPVKLAWQFAARRPFDGTPLESDSGVVYAVAGSEIIALDSEQGQLRWKQKVGALNRYSIVLPYADSVLLTTMQDSIIWSLNSQDGSLNWQTDLTEFVQASAPSLKPQVVRAFYDGTRIYLIIALWRGTQVVALEPSTGRLLWIGPPELSTLISNPDMATLTNGSLTMISNSIEVVLDVATGRLLRQLPLMLDSFHPPEIKDGTIYTNGDQVRAIEETTIREKWRFENPCGLPVHKVYPRLLSDDIIYVAATCGGLYALDATDGRVLWEFSASDESPVEELASFRGLGYALTDDAKLYAIDLSTGSVVGEAQFAPATTPIEVAEALTSGDQLLMLHFGGNSLFAFQ